MTARADDALATAATVAHTLGPVAAIPVGEGRAYAVDGVQVAVFRLRSGAVRAVSAVCPHRGGPLADGQADDSVVICPLHAHVFELATGACRTGQPPVSSYPVSVDDAGQLVVEVPVPEA
jgi:nitrite reductase (NADH) small subunit